MAGKAANRQRVPHKVRVGFLGGGARFTGELVDISSSGLLIRCEKAPPAGTVGQLGIEIGNETIRAVVRVSRIVPGIGMACKFTNMSPRDHQALEGLLLRLLKTLGTKPPVPEKPSSKSSS